MEVDEVVRFVPLGGLGEIGMNCFALEQEGKILIVDCGVAFSDEELGIDVIHPDFSWLLEREESIVGLFITHGHEDHIGAVPYFLARLKEVIPIYAPPHAFLLLTERLKEGGFPSACLREVEVGEKYALGPFVVEAIPVAHSIIDATALCIQTCAGAILHTGDFDLDEEQPAGQVTDSFRLQELGEEGIRLLLSDSTNIDRVECGLSEGDVGKILEKLVASATERVVVGMFSSNIHRIVALVHAAELSGRKLCFLGKSLQRHFRVAQKLGRVKVASDLVVAPGALSELPRSSVLIVAGGSQGEGPSALRRMSVGRLPAVSLEEGDLLILSSRAIPGNEKKVFAMINHFTRRGVKVESVATNSAIHVSGHASRAELSQMIEWLVPQSFIPVHGTLHHLLRHEELAKEWGVSDTLVVENGASIEIRAKEPLRIGQTVQHGVIRVSLGGRELSPALRKRRGELARGGVVFVSVTVEEQSDKLVSLQLSSLGVPGVEGEVAQRLGQKITISLERHEGERMLSLQERIEKVARREVGRINGERPLVEVHIRRINASRLELER